MSAGLLQCIQNTTEANCIPATGNAPCETTKSIKGSGSSGNRRGRNRRRLPKDRRRGSDRSDCRHCLRSRLHGRKEALNPTAGGRKQPVCPEAESRIPESTDRAAPAGVPTCVRTYNIGKNPTHYAPRSTIIWQIRDTRGDLRPFCEIPQRNPANQSKSPIESNRSVTTFPVSERFFYNHPLANPTQMCYNKVEQTIDFQKPGEQNDPKAPE